MSEKHRLCIPERFCLLRFFLPLQMIKSASSQARRAALRSLPLYFSPRQRKIMHADAVSHRVLFLVVERHAVLLISLPREDDDFPNIDDHARSVASCRGRILGNANYISGNELLCLRNVPLPLPPLSLSSGSPPSFTSDLRKVFQ